MRPLSSWDRFRQEGVSVLRCQHRLPAVIHTAALESAPSELPRAPQGSPALLQSLHERSLPLLPSQTLRQSQITFRWVTRSQRSDPSSSIHGAEPERIPLSSTPAALRAPGRGEARRWGQGRQLGAGAAGPKGREPPTYNTHIQHTTHTHTDTGKERSGCLEVVGTGSAGQSNGMGSLPRSSELPRRAALQFRAFLSGGHTRTCVAAQQNQQFPTLQP